VARFLISIPNSRRLTCARRFFVYLNDRLPTAARATGTNEEPEPLVGSLRPVPGTDAIQEKLSAEANDPESERPPGSDDLARSGSTTFFPERRKMEEVQPMRNQIFSLALGGLLTLGVSAAAMAQDNPAPAAAPTQDQGQAGRGPGRMNPDRQLEHMTRELGLSADQQNQIRPLLVDRQQKMQALFQNQSIAQEDRRARMQSIRQDTQAKIEAVLNDQQKQKFEAMQEHMRRGGPEGGPQGGPPEGAPQPQ
jgi:hypothetical protein